MRPTGSLRKQQVGRSECANANAIITLLCARLTCPEAIVLTTVNMLKLSICSVQTINEPCVNTHLMAYLRIRRHPVSCTAACSAAMKLDPVLVPGVRPSRARPLFECNLVT